MNVSSTDFPAVQHTSTIHISLSQVQHLYEVIVAKAMRLGATKFATTTACETPNRRYKY